MIIPNIEMASERRGVSGVMAQDSSGLFGAAQSLDVGADILLRKETRDADAYDIKTRPDFEIGMQKAMEEAKNEAPTPDKMTELFFEKTKTIYDGIYENAPNEVSKRKLEERYSDYKSVYGRQIVAQQAAENQALRALSVDDAVNKYINQIGVNGDYDNNIAAIDASVRDSSTFLSPLEQEKLRREKMLQAKQVKLDYELNQGNTREVQRLINDEAFSSDLSVKAVQQYREVVSQVKLKAQQTKLEDYPSYAIMENPNATDEDIINGQGGLIGLRSVLPKPTAKSIVEQVAKFQTADEMKGFITSIQGKHGKYAANAFLDLQKAGLPSAYSYMTQLHPQKDATRIEYLWEATKKTVGKDGKLVDGATLAKQSIANKITAEGGSYNSTFTSPFAQAWELKDSVLKDMGVPLNGRLTQRDLAEKLAIQHYDKHGDIDKAVTFATEHLFREARVTKIDGKQVPVPNDRDLKQIKRGAELIKQTVPVLAANVDSVSQTKAGALINTQSQWIVNDDNSGMILADRNGLPLRSEAGMMEYTWEQLEKIKVENDSFKGTLGKMSDLNAQLETMQNKKKGVIGGQPPLAIPNFGLKGRSNSGLMEYIDQ